MNKVASVTMNGAMRRPVIRQALTAPKATPIKMMAGIETKRETSDRKSPITTATRYITEPTDKSTPRTSSTKVMPIAITATWVDCVRMLRKLASERKRSESTPKARHRSANSINGANRSRIKTTVRESNRFKASSSIPQCSLHDRFAIELPSLEQATHLTSAHD